MMGEQYYLLPFSCKISYVLVYNQSAAFLNTISINYKEIYIDQYYNNNLRRKIKIHAMPSGYTSRIGCIWGQNPIHGKYHHSIQNLILHPAQLTRKPAQIKERISARNTRIRC